jgi:hypothetical protein
MTRQGGKLTNDMTHHHLRSARQKGERIGIVPFRVLAYLLHATGLERFYKPRYIRHSALFELTDEVVAKLPKYCHTISGVQGDPMNLIFVAEEASLKKTFKRAGWKRGNPASPIHVMYGAIMVLLKRPYEQGPFAPLYVNIALQDLAYQKGTKSRHYGERHHLRIWRTGIVLSDNKRVWIAAAGFEDGMRFSTAIPFWTHRLDPNIDKERAFIVKSLENVGARYLKSVDMTPAVYASSPVTNAHSSVYFTDGKASVVEL